MQLLSTLVAAALLAPAAAQTWTKCNPLQGKCPNDPGLNKKHWSCDFVKHGAAAMKDWKVTSGHHIPHGPKGAEFIINDKKDSPTIQTKFNIMFGHVEVTMLAAPGQGIVSSIVLESDDLDEIDWEWVGADHANAQSNFYGKGNTTTYDRGAVHPVQGPMVQRHTYGIDWTKDRIQWIIDGHVVRTVPFNDPLALGGRGYPQTPSSLRLGIWPAGIPGAHPGTIQWAGGMVQFDKAPFKMYVEKVKVTNYNPAAAYKYKGHSGSYKSIQKIHHHKKQHKGSKERGDAPQIGNNRRPGPADAPPQYTTSAPSYTTPAPYPYGNGTTTTPPGSTGGFTYHPGSTTTGGPGSSATPTAAGNALKAQVGGAVVGLLGVAALL